MSKTKPTNVAMDRVKSYVDRLEKMEEERKAIGGDIRDIYLEAKGNGFDVKTLRWLLSERKVDAAERDERDALRAVYANALGMAVDLVEVNGLSLRQASKRTGIPKSNIHRALAVPKVSQPAPSHDPATGEITTAGLDTPPVGSSELSEGHSSAAPDSDPVMRAVIGDTLKAMEKAMEKAAVPDLQPGTGSATVVATGNLDALSPILTSPEKLQHAPCITDEAGAVAEAQPERVARQPSSSAWREITACREALEAERKAARDAERERRRAAHAEWVKKNAEIDADPLTPPAFLDRRQRASA
mgnify:CR=1 FL=1